MTSLPTITEVADQARATTDSVIAAASTYGVDAADALAAFNSLTTTGNRMVVVSGKLASGKDTIAPRALEILSAGQVRSHSFARALKDELDAIFATIRFWGSAARVHEPASLTAVQRRSLAGVLSVTHDIPLEQAYEYFTAAVACEVLSDPGVHSRVRTDAIRFALQKLGTDVRRAQDDLYWVKRTIPPMLEDVAAGVSVISTDGRFPNEIDVVRAFGGIAIRLDITEDTQIRRLSSRDGLRITEEARTHLSEMSLDDYPSFDVRISNDGPLEETLATLTRALTTLGLVAA